jgi:hypothetical protein
MAVWYTHQQLEKVTRDLYDNESAEAEAMGYGDWPEFDRAGPEVRDAFRARAADHLDGVTPIDLSKSLRLRNGGKIRGAKLTEDGLGIVAEADGYTAKWQIDGFASGGFPRRPDLADIVYA